MTAWANYDDVQQQLRSIGLIIDDGLKIASGKKSERCKIDGGDQEKRGWYRLHEWQMEPGVTMLVGAYGIFNGSKSDSFKIELTKKCAGCGADVGLKDKKCPACGQATFKKREFTDEQKAAFKARLEEDRRKAAAERAEEIERASKWATAVWRACTEATPGGHAYLVRKKLSGTGGARIFPGIDGIMLDGGDAKDYRYLATFAGHLVVPLCDATGRVFGLQFIAEKKDDKTGRDKTYWPRGLPVEGHYWLIGGSPKRICLVAEGFATAMTLHEASGQPVAVAFSAGNLLPVAKALNARTKRRARLLICADDDWVQKCKECSTYTPIRQPICAHCGKEHGQINAGIERTKEVTLAFDNAEGFRPVFTVERPADRKGPTDFNDLADLEGLQVVTAQYEQRIADLKWAEAAAPASATALSARPPGAQLGGAGEYLRETLKGLLDVDEACERFALIYGAGGSLFDHQEHILVPKSDVMDILVDHGWREWKLRSDRKVVRLQEVGFDPGMQDPQILCNLWGGWPTKPQSGRCEALLRLLKYLCQEEDKPEHLYHWILCWLAYPIQNPGAKMKTALVMHGPQGAGKNMFFEAIMAIYGEYGRIVDQSAIEDKFNDWASKKLFMIADEVVARQELYHVKNKLKHLITGDWIRINPKNVAAHDERNHVNLVFLSNETQPLVLERDDRRFTVIWTPAKMPPNYYAEVTDEIEAGGIAALHDYLLNYDIGDFKPHTNPPQTKAKTELIEQSMDSTERFWLQWTRGELDGVPVVPCRSRDLYELYKTWCARVGIARPAAEHILLANIGKRADCARSIERYYVTGSTLKQCTFVIPSSTESIYEVGADKKNWFTEGYISFKAGAETWKNAA